MVTRLGWLNIFNPLKPSFNYSLPLIYWDNRTLLVTLIEMGKAEGEEQLKDDSRTDVTLAGWLSTLPYPSSCDHNSSIDIYTNIMKFH